MIKDQAQKIRQFFGKVYEKLVRMDDHPHKIGLGVGVGIFVGNMPGLGPLTAFFIAVFFRLNKVAAVAGSFVVNTWFSVISFIVAVQMAAISSGVGVESIKKAWEELLKNFHWNNLFNLFAQKVILSVMLWYCAISLIMGILGYVVVVLLLSVVRKKEQGNK